jgi:hypothetical protein
LMFHYEIEHFVLGIHICSVYFTLHATPIKMSNGAQYGWNEGRYWASNRNYCKAR